MKDYLTETIELGKRAIDARLISSFAVVPSPETPTLESRTFYIPDQQTGQPLTIEQAHSYFKNLLKIP